MPRVFVNVLVNFGCPCPIFFWFLSVVLMEKNKIIFHLVLNIHIKIELNINLNIKKFHLKGKIFLNNNTFISKSTQIQNLINK